MKLQAKIAAAYLDDLLISKKQYEFRQLETITLTDERGRSRVFDILNIFVLPQGQKKKIMRFYSDVPWDPQKKILRMELRPSKPLKA